MTIAGWAWLAWAGLLGPGAAAGAPPGAASRPAADGATVAELAGRLDDPSYRVRQEASEALVERGAGAYAGLRAAFGEAGTYERRRRIRQIVERIYVEEELGPAGAFLGVQHRAVGPSEDGRVPAGTLGIRVVDVIGGTAAERAGVRRDDIVMGLDEETIGPVDADGGAGGEPGMVTPEMRFAQTISGRKPGDRCTLMVLRGQERLRLEVRLGRRPWNQPFEYGYPQGVQGRLRERRKGFEAWWRGTFDPRGEVGGELPSVEDKRWRLESAGAGAA